MEENLIIFDENLYKKNIEENSYPEEDEFGNLSDEDKAELKEMGLI